MRGRNSSADLRPGLGEQVASRLLPISSSGQKRKNPGGLEAEPPASIKDPVRSFKPPLGVAASRCVSGAAMAEAIHCWRIQRSVAGRSGSRRVHLNAHER
jgi:hypothetical protein